MPPCWRGAVRFHPRPWKARHSAGGRPNDSIWRAWFPTAPRQCAGCGYLRFTDTRANKVFVTIECLYGFTAAKMDALKRLVKP